MQKSDNLNKNGKFPEQIQAAGLIEKLPLEKFIPSAFLIFLLLFIVLSIITFNSINKYQESVNQVSRTQEIVQKLDEVNLLLTKLQLQRRGYIVKKDPQYLEDYNQTKKNLKSELENLKDLASDNPAQTQIIKLAEEVKREQTLLVMISQDYLDKIYILSNEMKAAENNLLAKRQELSRASLQSTQLFIIITSILAFLVLGISLYAAMKLIRNKNKAETLLHKSYDELEDKVEERTSELKELNENLIIEVNNRIKIEGSLRESETRFRMVADSSPVYIWMSGADKQFHYFSKGWLEFTGRTTDNERGYGWIKSIHPDDKERFINIYEIAFDKREAFEIEFRMLSSGGEYIWFLDKGVPRHEGNLFTGYIGVCVDIHSKKRTERYLQIQYRVSKTLAEAATTDETFGNVLRDICECVNWSFGIVWVVSGDKIISKVMWAEDEALKDAYLEYYDEKYTFEKGVGLPGRVWKTNKPQWIDIKTDNNFPRKPGITALGWKSCFAIPISDGGKVMAVIECFNETVLSPKNDLLDVLESAGRQVGSFLVRKKAEELLQESHEELEKRVTERTLELASTLNRLLDEIAQKEKIQSKLKLFAHAIKGIKECIFITDLDNKTLFVNSAYESLYGYLEKDILDKNNPVLFSTAVPEEQRRQILTSTIKTGWRGELVNIRKDGSRFDVALSTSVIRNDDGNAEAIVGIALDITEDKQTQLLLNKRNSLLSLLNDVIAGVNRIEGMEECLNFAINNVCRYTGWDIGHFLFLDNDILLSSKIWYSNVDKKYQRFIDFTEAIALSVKEGFIHDVVTGSKPYWVRIHDLTNRLIYKRADLCKELGIKTCLWVPVVSQKKVIGVMEFFNKEDIEFDNEIVDGVNNIAFELGNMVERNEFIKLIQEREAHFKAVADSANEAIVSIDHLGNVIYVNKSVEDVFGYSHDELINSNLEMLMPSGIKIHTNGSGGITQEAEITRLVGNTTELTGKRKNGQKFPVELSLAKWEMNNETYFTGMIRDISMKKQIESELIEKQKMLENSQKIARLGSWEWDVVRNFITWSDEMFAIYGLKPGEFIPTYEGYLQRIHPDDVELSRNVVSNAFKDKASFSYFHRVITPDNKVKILKAQGEVKTNEKGEVIKMFGTGMDVTDVKKAEDAIQKREKQLNEAQHIAKIGSWEMDIAAGKIEWSDELYRIYGMEYGEDLTYKSIKKYTHHEDKSMMGDFVKNLERNPYNTEINYRIVTKTGVLKYLASEIRVERNEKTGEPVRLYGSVQDITEIKIVNEELKKTNEALVNTQKELVHNEKLAALGRFSSGIAHEIRNPLANISALAQLVSRSKIDDEKIKKHLKYILVNSDIANKIIKDLLHFASPDELVFSNENLSNILNSIIDSVEPRCSENKISVKKEIASDIPEMYIDKTKLENSLLNFLSNAIDAMPQGGNLVINAAADELKKEITIDIIDTGQGIPHENIDKIFEPFFTTKETGTGLGLGLAYQTIKLHHGVLNIFSEVEKGTHIELKLPIRKIEENGKNSNN